MSASVVESECCVVGGGPAGLTVARALAQRGHEVTLLESCAQDLNQGTSEGDPYAGLSATRHRGLGGSALLWNTPIQGKPGAKFVPLDETDFHDWPFGRDALLPWYREAQRCCGLGPFDYSSSAGWEFPDSTLSTGVYQFGPADPFTAAYVGEPGRYRKATVVELRLAPGSDRVSELRAVRADGTVLVVRADSFVLAGGAIENARLLLAAGLGNASGWVGRCFMEHPRDSALTLVPARERFSSQAPFYDLHRTGDGTWICGRLTPAPGVARERGLPNASVTLLPLWDRASDTAGARLRRLLATGSWRLPPGYGWSRHLAGPDRPPAYRLYLNLEQRPHPENRIVLGSARDRYGVPKAALTWRWRTEEQEGLGRLRRFFAEAIEAAGLGQVRIDEAARPDPNAHHHAGTTRMDRAPEGGVVDSDCRVHGVENLYVAGASVFPSAGFANPTLTIVALALRLADHLAACSILPGRVRSRGL